MHGLPGVRCPAAFQPLKDNFKPIIRDWGKKIYIVILTGL
jgi:hypothetical protein